MNYREAYERWTGLKWEEHNPAEYANVPMPEGLTILEALFGPAKAPAPEGYQYAKYWKYVPEPPAVSSALAGMVLQETLDQGGTVEIPSLGISITKEKSDEKPLP